MLTQEYITKALNHPFQCFHVAKRTIAIISIMLYVHVTAYVGVVVVTYLCRRSSLERLSSPFASSFVYVAVTGLWIPPPREPTTPDRVENVTMCLLARRGWHSSSQVFWQRRSVAPVELPNELCYPNKLNYHILDTAFGGLCTSTLLAINNVGRM